MENSPKLSEMLGIGQVVKKSVCRVTV